MKRRIIALSVLVIISLALTELHSVFYHYRPKLARMQVDLFWSPTYHRNLTLQWFCKMTFDTVFKITAFFSAAMVSARYSLKLTMVFLVVFLYCVIDLFLFWYNYSSGVAMYWIMLGAAVLAVLLILLPLKEPSGKYKSML